jgi:hydroxymethylglutaryl-CoA lyase
MHAHPSHVTVVEVGPRDGLQNESGTISTHDKIAFVDLLSASGLRIIEASAFVSPKWVPQMADAAAVFGGIARRAGTEYMALVPNVAGLEQAHAANVRQVAVFAAASETFSRRNINKSIAESLDAYREVCDQAAELGIRVRGYVSTSFGCPFEGAVPPSRVAEVSRALVEMGAYEVAVSDTIGIAHPRQVEDVVKVVAGQIAREQIALHFHDTRGTALANVLAALDMGISTFDSSAGGLGGCPYAPGATGNLATEDLIYMLDGLGIETHVDLNAVITASQFIEPRIGHPLPSRYYRAAVARRRPS